MSELKLCPFCGGEADVHSWWSDADECGRASVGCKRESYSNGYECARIYIRRCDAKTAERDAIRIWNTRHRETCEVVSSYSYGISADEIWDYELSCGHVYTAVGKESPSFCEECGREVVK